MRAAARVIALGLALALAVAWPVAAQDPVADAASDALGEPRFLGVGGPAIPRDVVAALAQDRAGFLWIATGDGLVRYDGHRFRAQQRDSADPAERNLGWIRALLPGRDGRVWIGTESDGLAVYDPRSDRVETHRAAEARAGASPTILALAEDPDGAIWAGTAGGGLQRFDPARAQFNQHRADARPGSLPDDRVHALLVDRAGSLWVGSWAGLSRRVRGSDRFDPVLQAAADSAGPSVQALFEDANGRVWVGARSGAVHVVDPLTLHAQLVAPASPGAVSGFAETPDGRVWVGRSVGIDVHDRRDGRLLRSLRHDPRQLHGLGGGEVTALVRDRDGALWVGGFGLGLQRHDPGQQAILLRAADPDPASPFGQADVRALLQRRSGEVWAATAQRGVVVMDPRLRVIGPLARSPASAPTWPVNAMFEAADGSVWLGGESELRQLGADHRLLRTVRHGAGQTHGIAQSRDAALWIATQDGLYRLAPGATVPERIGLADGAALAGTVFALAMAPDGALWAGGVRGLFRVAPGGSALRPVESDSAAGALGNPIVIGLMFDRRQTLWVDTAVTGLHRLVDWDGTRARFHRVSLRHGVHQRPFGASLQEDAQGRIWTHMHVYDPASDLLRELTPADGVLFGTGWFRSTARTDDGMLLFGGSRGLLAVRPERFRPGGFAAPLVATELRIDGQRAPAGRLSGGVVLGPGHRSLSIEFAALDYRDAGRNRYAVRLEGLDPEWTQTGAELRVASYGRLDPGRYTLRVRAAGHDGAWGAQELSIPVTVEPAWWQLGSVRLLALVLAALLGWLVLEWRTRRLRRQGRVLERAVGERTAELERARAELEDRVEARTRELAAATGAAEAANRAKTSFLQSMSHEMRTPLNAILGLTHAQQRAAADVQQRDRLGLVIRAARHLLGVIDNVLDFSRIEAGQATLVPVPFTVASLFDTVTAVLGPEAAERQLALHVEADARLASHTLLGDAQRLAEILINFGGNALKFSDRGTVRISATIEAEDAAGMTLRFDVEDQGPGIAAELQGRLFRAFERLEDFTAVQRGGTGLGLAISRRSAELMRGRVGIDSAPGRGSRFWLVVTLAKTAAVPALSAEPEAPRFNGERVLVAEDDAVNQLVAVATLSGAGLRVDVAHDGAEAVRLAAQHRYALILMDLQMPALDGIAATQAIRAGEQGHRVPILAFSALAFDTDRDRCLAAGMDDHVRKPAMPDELLATLRRWIAPPPGA